MLLGFVVEEGKPGFESETRILPKKINMIIPKLPYRKFFCNASYPQYLHFFQVALSYKSKWRLLGFGYGKLSISKQIEKVQKTFLFLAKRHCFFAWFKRHKSNISMGERNIFTKPVAFIPLIADI